MKEFYEIHWYNFLLQIERNPSWFFTVLLVTVVAIITLFVLLTNCERS